MASGAQSSYVFGNSGVEQDRLQLQARILRDCTERMLLAAGIQPGMRVLDLGCGMGDVCLLAAELTGASGTVVGIDRDAAAVEKARARSGGKFLSEHAEFDDYKPEERFDAVIGRYVLIHQPDPAALLRKAAARLLRPGGILAFHELDFLNLGQSYPEAPLWKKTSQLIVDAFTRSGVPCDFGAKLARTFFDAGLPYPEVRVEVIVGGGPGSPLYSWISETVRSLLPKIEQLRLGTADEIQVDTLAARIEAEAVANGCQFMGPIQCMAWRRV